MKKSCPVSLPGIPVLVLSVIMIMIMMTAGCHTPQVYWWQEVQLNGREFKFAKIDSFRDGAEGQRVDYQDGRFVVSGDGPITVNGFEINVLESEVVLANHHMELSPGEQIRFASDMSWKVVPASKSGR